MTSPSCWDALKNLQKITPSDPVVSALLDINARLDVLQLTQSQEIAIDKHKLNAARALLKSLQNDTVHCSQDEPKELWQIVEVKKIERIRSIATRVKSLLDSYRRQTYSEMDPELRSIYEDLNSLID